MPPAAANEYVRGGYSLGLLHGLGAVVHADAGTENLRARGRPRTEKLDARLGCARRGGAFYGMVKAGLERFSQSLAMEVADENIAVNVLSPQGRIKTPGNIFARNDPEHPRLDFGDTQWMGKAAAWIAMQPFDYTGQNVLDDMIRYWLEGIA